MTKTVAIADRSTTTAAHPGAGPPSTTACSAAPSTVSLLKNPASGGTPASAAKPIVIVQNVTGMSSRSPPMRPSRLLPTTWMTAPAHRNSNALNAAWVSRWNKPAL